MHGLCTLAPLYQSVEKFEVPSFTNYKDMIESKILKNGSRDSDHVPFVTIGWLGFETVYLLAQCDDSSFNFRHSRHSLGALKFKVDHVPLTMPTLLPVASTMHGRFWQQCRSNVRLCRNDEISTPFWQQS